AFERTVEVNLLGVWRTVRAVLPHLISSRGYCLVVSSLAAVVHAPGMAAYSASKAGCAAFADSLRAEVRHLGVAVGVAYFSWIDTDMVNSSEGHPALSGLRGRRLPGPLGRKYPVSDVARAVLAGVNRRAPRIYVPGWAGGARLLWGLLDRLWTRIAPIGAAVTDHALLEDVAARGAASSRPMGPGGAAGFRGGQRG
ncbi:MAG: SDR family NAD(P)-dependent oxidoreductase, partial [Kutzneria sp.]|nr:SDR family NAD(P)-dependent oxidoreductase [Kutzneria sp.]